jgi:cobalt-precorrin-7 (C5)-methyltransferase
VLGWDLDILPVQDLVTNKRIFVQDVSNFDRVAGEAARYCLSEGKDIAVLRIGDPCVSSGLSGLLKVFADYDIEVVPGISSIQTAAAFCKISIDDSAIVSFHEFGDPEAKKRFMINAFSAGRHIIMLSSPDMRPENAAKYLMQHGFPESSRGHVLSRMTLPDAAIFSGTLKEISVRTFDWLSIAVFLNPNVPDALETRTIWEEWRRGGTA